MVKALIVFLSLNLVICLPVSSQTDEAALFAKDPRNPKEMSNNLLVFVGQKITFSPITVERDAHDQMAFAKYRVLKRVYGELRQDTIEFVAYDHYGVFAFSEFNTVLLYVRRVADRYYQIKYTYDALYETTTGRWASPYNPSNYKYKANKEGSIKPVKIEFKNPPSYDILGKSKREMKIWFPKQYYHVKDGRATAVFGNYLEELFVLKKRGVLTANGFF